MKPVSTLCRLINVRTNSPAPISSNSDSDTCAATSDLLSSERDAALELLPLSFSAGVRSRRVARKAGTIPNTIPVKNDSPRVKPSTRRSRRGLSEIISLPAHSLTPNRLSLIQSAINMPTPPPSTARSTLSVSNWRLRRQRLAPIARRTAISLRREDARTNRRFATLAQAISSTKPTTPNSR